MASQLPLAEGASAVPIQMSPARLAVLARLAVDGGAGRAELGRDLGGLVAKAAIDIELAALTACALCLDKKGRLAATEAGKAVVADVLGLRTWPKLWPDMRDVRLVAKALGLEQVAASRIKALARPEDLRAEIVGRAFGLKHRAAATPSRLRADLAVIALERAFGNRIKGGLGAGAGAGFAPKAGRMLASQLLEKPRDLGTDARLVAALAAEQAGAKGTDAGALRSAILKSWLGSASLDPVLPRGAGAGVAAQEKPAPVLAPAPMPVAVEAPQVAAAQPLPASPQRPAAANRPDLAGFVREVQRAAAEKAQGWPGNRKAFVSQVFEVLAARHPAWGLSEIEFKAMLAEAHRTGHLALSTADLRDKSQMQALARSAITYKNTVWHLVRVAE